MTAEALTTIQTRLAEQDNHATADPLFLVMQKRRIWAVIPEYSSTTVWVNQAAEAEDREADEHMTKVLNRFYRWFRSEPREWVQMGVIEIDEFVTAMFTELACKEYIQANGHNLRQPFTYAASLYRNPEMIGIRNALAKGELHV